jgi:glycosyltransferase involved in cell wall biosynthesis
MHLFDECRNSGCSMKHYNILYHFRVRGAGAEAVHIAGIANAFRDLGHTVVFVSPTRVDPTQEYAESSRNGEDSGYFSRMLHFLADWVPQPIFEIMEIIYNMIAIPRLLKALRNHRVDFIYERYAFFNVAGALASYLLRKPFIVEVNEISGFKRVRGQCFVQLARVLEKVVFQRAMLIITVSEFLRSQIAEVVGVHKKIVVIPNGVPRQWIERRPSIEAVDSIRESYGLVGKKIVCFIGGLVQWHNFDLLLEVFRDIQRAVPDSALLIVGDGPMREEIEHKASKLGCRSSVILTGSVPHQAIPLYICAVDLTVIPETNDFRSPIKMFEYMSMGKPVVAPRMPAIKCVIEDEKDGLLFDSGNAAEFKDALLRLLNSRDERNAMGASAFRKIRDGFTWEIHAKQIVRLITSICETQHPIQEMGDQSLPAE